MNQSLNKGHLLIEILLASALFAIVVPALMVGMSTATDGKAQQLQRLQASTLFREAQEALRSVREKGWETFAQNGTYYPTVSGDSWSLASGTETIDTFSRQIVISDAYRDSSGKITTSGGTLDPSTKKIVTSVWWQNPLPASISATSYLTRYTNLSFVQTTQADFDAGVRTNTFTTNTDGGEVTLGAGGGGGDWCIPSKSITEYDLPKSGVANAITAIEGRLFAGTGNNSSGVSFADVQLTTNADPPQVISSKTFDGYKTNAVFGEANFAYMTTDNNSKEVVIIDLNQYSDPPTNLKYKEVGSINLPAVQDVLTIYVVNDKAYVIQGTKFYIYSLSSDRTTATLLNSGGYTLSGNGKKVLVGSSGQYAYIVTDSTTNNFEILNVSTPGSPTRVSMITVGSSQAGIDLFVTSSETNVYIALAYSAGHNNIFKIDTSTKSSPQIGQGYSTNSMTPKGIAAVTGNRLIVVGTGGTYQYQVINTNTMTSCSATSNLAYATGIYGIAAVLQSNGYAYSYIITGDANAELKIILGGAGGSYTSAGTFESAIFDANVSTVFNRFSAQISQPAETTIKLQVAAAPAVNGSCTNAVFNYVGPNGVAGASASAYFVPSGSTIVSAIPYGDYGDYENPNRCFRYKAFLTTNDVNQTPTLYDMTVNYSP